VLASERVGTYVRPRLDARACTSFRVPHVVLRRPNVINIEKRGGGGGRMCLWFGRTRDVP
jgi:hypothetical protein